MDAVLETLTIFVDLTTEPKTSRVLSIENKVIDKSSVFLLYGQFVEIRKDTNYDYVFNENFGVLIQNEKLRAMFHLCNKSEGHALKLLPIDQNTPFGILEGTGRKENGLLCGAPPLSFHLPCRRRLRSVDTKGHDVNTEEGKRAFNDELKRVKAVEAARLLAIEHERLAKEKERENT